MLAANGAPARTRLQVNVDQHATVFLAQPFRPADASGRAKIRAPIRRFQLLTPNACDP